jgi:hypothetical protein
MPSRESKNAAGLKYADCICSLLAQFHSHVDRLTFQSGFRVRHYMKTDVGGDMCERAVCEAGVLLIDQSSCEQVRPGRIGLLT